jgi:hypothetical protein
MSDSAEKNKRKKSNFYDFRHFSVKAHKKSRAGLSGLFVKYSPERYQSRLHSA